MAMYPVLHDSPRRDFGPKVWRNSRAMTPDETGRPSFELVVPYDHALAVKLSPEAKAIWRLLQKLADDGTCRPCRVEELAPLLGHRHDQAIEVLRELERCHFVKSRPVEQRGAMKG